MVGLPTQGRRQGEDLLGCADASRRSAWTFREPSSTAPGGDAPLPGWTLPPPRRRAGSPRSVGGGCGRQRCAVVPGGWQAPLPRGAPRWDGDAGAVGGTAVVVAELVPGQGGAGEAARAVVGVRRGPGDGAGAHANKQLRRRPILRGVSRNNDLVNEFGSILDEPKCPSTTPPNPDPRARLKTPSHHLAIPVRAVLLGLRIAGQRGRKQGRAEY